MSIKTINLQYEKMKNLNKFFHKMSLSDKKGKRIACCKYCNCLSYQYCDYCEFDDYTGQRINTENLYYVKENEEDKLQISEIKKLTGCDVYFTRNLVSEDKIKVDKDIENDETNA